MVEPFCWGRVIYKLFAKPVRLCLDRVRRTARQTSSSLHQHKLESHPSHQTVMAFFGGNAGAQAGPSAAANANNQGDLSKDIELTAPPEDSVSDISFSSQSEHLAVASWDKKVRIYEISATGSSVGKAVYEHEGPVLSVVWSKVGALFPSISFFTIC